MKRRFNDGIYILDPSSGHYEREEQPASHPVLLLGLLVGTGWIAFIGIAYCAYCAVEAFLA